MARRDVAGRKIARAAGWMGDAERLLSEPVDAFLANESREGPAAVLRRLRHGGRPVTPTVLLGAILRAAPLSWRDAS